MSKKILHVCNLDKFIPSFVSFVESHFEPKNHQFWLSGDSRKYQVDTTIPTYYVGQGKRSLLAGYANLIKSMHSADRILLHGLFNSRVVQILWLMPWLLPKTYWLVWGGDLYTSDKPEGSRNQLNEFFRKKVIRDMGQIVTSIDGDVENIRRRYNAKGRRLNLFAYPASLFVKVDSASKNSGAERTIMVGNSAHPANNHILVFEKIVQEKSPVHIICPLSYGDISYRNEVIERGHELFGDKFIPITQLMPVEEYNQILGRVDGAIFAHERQQAMSTIRTLLGMEKPVFMNPKSTGFRHLTNAGLKLFELTDKLTEINQFQDGAKNRKIIEKNYSEEALKENLERLFNE